MHGTFAQNDLALGPLYKRVKTLLVEGLARGDWQPNGAIPSESRLAEQHNVSIGTIRKAIDELVAEKILVRQQGRGTFVAAHGEDRFLYHFFHIVGADRVKHFPVAKLLSFKKIRADALVAERLGLTRSDRVIQIRNALWLEGEAIEIDTIYLSSTLFHDLSRDIFVARPSTIYQLYQVRYGQNVIRTTERLRATAAQAEEAEILDIPAGAPMLEIERVAYTYSDSPVEFRVSRVNTAQHVYLNDLDRIP